MSGKFIAVVVAVALVITAFGNSRARADDDLVRLLAAIAGAAIVGTIVTRSATGGVDDAAVTRNTRDWDRPAASVPALRRIEPRPLPRSVRQQLLPGDCLRSFNTDEGRIRVFGKKCLKKNFDHADSLPKACAVKFRTFKKMQHGYDARCLRDEGYRLARS